MQIVFDKTARTVDDFGRLHVERSHISKAAVNPYYGEEIPDYENLGLEPKRIYNMYRPPEELAKAAPTFNRLPILIKHIAHTADAPQNAHVVGAIGSDVEFNAPYLDASLSFWDARAIAAIEAEQVKELSCGYRYTPIMKAGEADGMAYDGIMTDIIGNHLALVETGRAGADVVVADSNPFTKLEQFKMSLKMLAGAFKKHVLAMDSGVDPEQADKIIDALLDVQEPNATQPETPAQEADMGTDADGVEGKIRALLAGKVDDSIIAEICGLIAPAQAADEDKTEEEGETKSEEKAEEIKQAMDSLRSEMRAQYRMANDARLDVRHVVGDVRGVETAEEIYTLALDHMGVKHEGVKDAAGLKAVFFAANTKKAEAPKVVGDSASVAFPMASRFTQA